MIFASSHQPRHRPRPPRRHCPSCPPAPRWMPCARSSDSITAGAAVLEAAGRHEPLAFQQCRPAARAARTSGVQPSPMLIGARPASAARRGSARCCASPRRSGRAPMPGSGVSSRGALLGAAPAGGHRAARSGRCGGSRYASVSMPRRLALSAAARGKTCHPCKHSTFLAHLAAELVALDSRSSVSNLAARRPSSNTSCAASRWSGSTTRDAAGGGEAGAGGRIAARKAAYALSGHMDTVPDTGWQQDPWSGRGSITTASLHGLGSVGHVGPGRRLHHGGEVGSRRMSRRPC